MRVARRKTRTGFSAASRVGGADDLWLIFTLLGPTLNQKSSVTQIASLVACALTGEQY
ncbi:MAG: hypothetical protein ACK5WA_05405 [Alphaproteobacteria bacterium]